MCDQRQVLHKDFNAFCRKNDPKGFAQGDLARQADIITGNNVVMPVTPEARQKFEKSLTAAAEIRMKAMFGGFGIYLDEALFGLIDDDRIYFKVDQSNLPDYDAAGAGPWVMHDGKPNLKYREVPGAVLNNPAELRAWIELAAAVARANAKPKKKGS